jgi:hypothetical protein
MTTTPPKFVLPGTWGRINLASEAATQRSIRKVLEHVTRRRDDMADTRQQLRSRIQKAADIAREAGANDFYLAFSLTPKVPLPAWISVFTPEIDSTDFDALGLGELKSFLDAGTRSWGPDGAAVVTGEVSESIHAVRHSWRRVVDVVEGDAERAFEFVEADYWIAAANPNRLALLTFSTALAEYEEEMLSLFDAVVSTIRWPAPAAVPAA